jgi:hypothetical protein
MIRVREFNTLSRIADDNSVAIIPIAAELSAERTATFGLHRGSRDNSERPFGHRNRNHWSHRND